MLVRVQMFAVRRIMSAKFVAISLEGGMKVVLVL